MFHHLSFSLVTRLEAVASLAAERYGQLPSASYQWTGLIDMWHGECLTPGRSGMNGNAELVDPTSPIIPSIW
jgi:hypothetical protein